MQQQQSDTTAPEWQTAKPELRFEAALGLLSRKGYRWHR